jgi:excisionase family DNA binding protein
MTSGTKQRLNDEWLTVAEAAERFHVSRDTIYRWARQEKLCLYKIAGTTTRVRRQDLDALAHPIGSDSWTHLSEASFADWGNPKDAVYDEWKSLYGVSKR